MTECCICLTEINKTTGQVDMSCSHKYHLKCISKWLSNHSTCPMCRAKTSEMETLEKKKVYEDVISGAGGRIMYYIENYNNYVWNESMIPTSTPHNSGVEFNNVIVTPISHETIQQTEFPSDDIRLVAQQAGVGVTRALDALRTTNGDIVNAILHLIQDI